MKQLILNYLEKIESDYNVKVLYAVESGSRAWGFASTDSDYDVRFVYIHPPKWYLTIGKKRDVIEYLDGEWDLAGWDIGKALFLFRKVNPPMLEWLTSPIVYLDRYGLADELRLIMKETFNPKACIYHYLHIAEGNYREYLKKDQVRLKKYFYVLRPLLACIWIMKRGTFPPVKFESMVEKIDMERGLRSEIADLLEKKRAGNELNLGPRIHAINNFIDKWIIRVNDYVKLVKVIRAKPFEFYDEIFHRKLSEVYGVDL